MQNKCDCDNEDEKNIWKYEMQMRLIISHFHNYQIQNLTETLHCPVTINSSWLKKVVPEINLIY